jgi:hypothetical protein
VINKMDSIAWLQRCAADYRSQENGWYVVVEELDKVRNLWQGFAAVDELEEINLGKEGESQPTYIKRGLAGDLRTKLCNLLWEFLDCSAWDYTDMPGLSRELVEHILPIKQGFRPHKQPARSFNPELLGKIMEEAERLLMAGFIKTCHYADWVSNIVPMEKKGSGKIRVYVDFCNLNRATPKDDYPMPNADDLINKALGNRVISFLDGNAEYNQMFMAVEGVSKTTFWCPGFIGLFEWVVMTFALKNAGAT